MRDFFAARSPRRVRTIGAVLIAVGLAFVSYAGPAHAVDDVDIDTTLLSPNDVTVPDAPYLLVVEVGNSGTTTATNVSVDVQVPSGAAIMQLAPNCSAVAAVVTCAFGTLEGNSGVGLSLFFTFGANGNYAFTASASVDQPDTDGDSTSQIDVDVVTENADLAGIPESRRVVVGTQPTAPVTQHFVNQGPTLAGGATVSGTVTGGATIVPESFNFFATFVGSGNIADEQCTVTATTFTCAPVFNTTIGAVTDPQVFYDVLLPTTASTVVAAATITGRADPNHANDTSTSTIDVDDPAAEIYTQIVTPPGAIASGEPFRVEGPVSNAGELAAEDLVAVLEAPADWAIAVPPDPLPPGVACTVIATPHAVRCTRATLPAGEQWSVDALVTPPAGFGTGTVSLSVTTPTPEIGLYPNEASTSITYAPGGQTRVLLIEPDTGLEDGDVVTLSGTGFNPNTGITYCQGIVTGMPPSPSDCGVPIQTTFSDANGAFSIAVTVERFLVVNNVGVIDCAQPGTTCGIGAADFFSPGGSAVSETVTFTPMAPVDDPFDARIAGTVTTGSGTPLPGTAVWAYQASDTWVGTLQTTTDASGNYVLEEAEPGIAYRIRFGAPSSSALVTEWWGGQGSAGAQSRATAVAVRLNAAQPVLDADAELATGGSLTGTVVGPGGAPVANATVWAYRNDDTWVGTYAMATAADGTYRIDSVRPGTELRIRFVPAAGSALAPEWFDNSTRRFSATPVVVAAGATVEASAQLSAAP